MRYPTKQAKSLALAGLFFLNSISSSSAQDISVQLDGQRLPFDQPPTRVQGRLMVPLRGIFEALKADVVYDGPTRSIQATKDSRVIQLQLGSRQAVIDGQTRILDVPANTIGGRTMVPLRFVAESLGAGVKWDGATKTVLMTSNGAPSVTGNASPTAQVDSGAQDGPKIDRFFHSATTELSPGDALNIVVYGEPKSQASFEILGSTNQIALREVGPGRYERRWIIPNGFSVNKGVLLAHLQMNGRETAMEAERQITIVSRATSSIPPSTWSEFPSASSVSRSLRPQIRATFPSDVQHNSIRLFVDGVDYSRRAQLRGRVVSWFPDFNMSVATHRVQLQALNSHGQRLSHTWDFRVDPQGSVTNSAQGFVLNETRPSNGTTVTSRPEIGALFNGNVREIEFFVDNISMANQRDVQRLTNGVLWTPAQDLSAGQHRARVKAVDQNGQVLEREWNFVVSTSGITRFTISPTQASSGENVTLSLQAPRGATGSFTVGQVRNIRLREVSPGRYQGNYQVRQSDRDQAVVSASLRLGNGQVIQGNSPTPLVFEASPTFTVSNLGNGMTVAPNFSVRGTGSPGKTIFVEIAYSSRKLVDVLTGQTRTVRTQGVVRSNGSYDIPVDAGVVKAGQQFKLVVSDGQNESVEMDLTRNR